MVKSRSCVTGNMFYQVHNIESHGKVNGEGE